MSFLKGVTLHSLAAWWKAEEYDSMAIEEMILSSAGNQFSSEEVQTQLSQAKSYYEECLWIPMGKECSAKKEVSSVESRQAWRKGRPLTISWQRKEGIEEKEREKWSAKQKSQCHLEEKENVKKMKERKRRKKKNGEKKCPGLETHQGGREWLVQWGSAPTCHSAWYGTGAQDMLNEWKKEDKETNKKQFWKRQHVHLLPSVY